jgi:hypothetical protein
MTRLDFGTELTESLAVEGNTITFDYHMRFQDGTEASFLIRLDPETLGIIHPEVFSPPEWTKLDFCRCPQCALDPAEHDRCPVAVSMAGLVDRFKDALSYRQVHVTVRTANRDYSNATTLQNALSSIAGILMTTSGCPILDRMRPMVATHLPFATPEETTYRTVSMYMFAQFTLNRYNLVPDWTLGHLIAYLKEVGEVNVAFCERLKAVPHKGDANVNALAILNSLASLTGITIEDMRLNRWETLFLRHWG